MLSIVKSNRKSSHRVRHFISCLHPLISWLRENNVDYTPILEEADIAIESLSKSDHMITPAQELCFIRKVVEQVNVPDLGLQVGVRHYPSTTYGMLGLAMMTSKNLYQCLKFIMENISLSPTYFAADLNEEKDLAFIQFNTVRDMGSLFQYMIDRDMSGGYILLNELLGKNITVEYIELTQSGSNYIESYNKLYNCPIKFNSQHNRMAFKKSWLYEPLPKADEDTSMSFLVQCESAAQSLLSRYSLSEHIRRYLCITPLSLAHLENVATVFNATSRTLQRKLKEENTTFQKLQDEVRHNMAIEYLTTTELSIDEIADRIGYSEKSAFSHAFKRWTKTTPASYRITAQKST